MSASNRAARITKLHKSLKKHYQPIKPATERSVLECLVFACCLEDEAYDKAEEAFARLAENFYDWNEVRVTTVMELGEEMSCLNDPESAAKRVKLALHAVFETHYTFDIDFLRKENLGKALQKLDNFGQLTKFTIAYTSQHGLGGHSIPVGDSTLAIFYILGIIDEKEMSKRQVPGLERAIPKNHGIEFASLIHQLAADLHKSPFGTRQRNIILEIDPSAKERLPKRTSAKKAKAKTDKKAAAKKEKAAKKPKAEKVEKPSKKIAKKSPKKPAAKVTGKKSSVKSGKVAKKPAAKTKKASKAASKTAASKKKTAKKKSPTKTLKKKKPR